MEYRRLGKSGLKVSEFSFGAWVTFAKQVGEDDAASLMGYAYDNGVNFFDNAEGYEKGNAEIVMGEALKALNWPRESYAVSSKVFWGTSEWTAQQQTEAYAEARQYNLTPPTMEQPEYNLFRREKVESEFLPLYGLFGLGTTIWSPLASGILTGKYNNGIPDDSRMNLPGYEWLKARLDSDKGKDELAKVKKLAKLADEAGLPLHHLALLWCNANPNVSTVILGASKLSQLKDNLKALDSKARLTPEVMAKIEEIVGNKPAGPLRY